MSTKHKNTLHIIKTQGSVADFLCYRWRRHNPSRLVHYYADVPNQWLTVNN